MMKVAKMSDGQPEIYLALQGEGATVGMPLVFVRLSTCNLHCVWCDTFYTWNFEGTKFDNEHKTAPKVNVIAEQMLLSEEEVAGFIAKAGGISHNAVFTGGEPTIQQKNIVKVMDVLNFKYSNDPNYGDWYFEIETNGTIIPIPELDHRLARYNISPKLSTSGNSQVLRERPDVLGWYGEQSRKNFRRVCFKFVVEKASTEQNLNEIDELVKKYGIDKKSVYLMPEGTQTQAMIDWSKEVAEICKDKGYSLSTRVQVILYGSKRAV